MNTFEKAREFIYRNARPLELARWQYHFENGSREAVLNILSHYQNPDGGFGHGLEPDSWNPNSTPIHTWWATERLCEIDFTDRTHPIIQGILKYLASGQDFDGKMWYYQVASTNGYPHAPWWHADTDRAESYNPTACLAGFIIRFADKDSDLYRLGCRIAKEAVEADDKRGLSDDMHSVRLYISLMEYCEQAGVRDVIDLPKLEERLQERVKRSINRDTAKWETSYICRPSVLFHNRESIFYAPNKEIADYECDFLVRTQHDDGSWNVTWNWGKNYPKEWAVSENMWKGINIVLNMRYLKGMGRL